MGPLGTYTLQLPVTVNYFNFSVCATKASTVIIFKVKKVLGPIFENPIINIPFLTFQLSPSSLWGNFFLPFYSPLNPVFPVKVSHDNQNA